MKDLPRFVARWVMLAAGLGLVELVASATASAQSGGVYDWNWATQLGPTGSGANRMAFVRGIAADAAGNVTIGGDFDPDLSFANESTLLQTNRPPQSGTGFTYTNGFLAQYRPNGRLVWTMNLDSNDANVSDVATDAVGNVYALGSYSRGIAFGTGPALTGGRVFLVKLNPAGIAQWAVNVGNTSRGATTWHLAVNAAGSSVVQGEFEGNITIGNQNYTGPGLAYHPFLARYDPDGALVGSWAGQQLSNKDQRSYTGLALAPTGETYLSGFVNGDILRFGTLPLVASTAANGANGFLLKVSAANLAEWVLMGNGVVNGFTDVKSSPTGGIYALLAKVPGVLMLGSQPLPTPNNDNTYVLRLTPRGTLLRSMSGTSSGSRLGLGPHDDLYIGAIGGVASWGNIQLPDVAAGQQQISVVRLDSVGRGLQGWPATGPSIFRGIKLAVDGLGQAAVAGWLYGTGTFRFGTHSVASPALNGMFVGRTGTLALATQTAQPVVGLELYPNPAQQTVVLKMTATTPALIQVLDAVGRVVTSQTLPRSGQVSLSGLAPGPYFVRVQQDDAVSYRHLVVLP